MAALVLAACGGGNAPPPPTPAPIPAQDDAETVAWSRGPSQTTMIDVLANDAAPADAALTVTAAPQHGKVVVTGGKVQYTPDDGYVGPDSFSYRVNAGARTGSATARLSVEASFSLSGVVAPQLAAGYTVSAKAGSAPAVLVQPSGDRYSVTVTVSDLAGMVTVTALGAGDQSHVLIKSIVGEVASLAKVGGMIDEKQRAALRLDVFSIARYGMFQRNGLQPTSDAELADSYKRISEFEVFGMVGGLRNAIADRTLLSPDFPTVADIAADPLALSRAVQAAKGKDSMPRDWSYEASLPTEPASPSPLIGPQGGRFAFIDGYRPSVFEAGQPPPARPNSSRVFDFRADGTVALWPSSEVLGTWARDGGAISIKANPGFRLESYAGVHTTYRTLKEYRLKELPRAGAGGPPMFQLTVTYSTVTCSIMQHWCQDGADGSWVALVAGFDLSRDMLAFLPSNFTAGARLVGLRPIVSASADGSCTTCFGGIPLAGSPSVLGLNGAITEDGRWILSGTGFATRYTRLIRYGNGIETWLAEYEVNGKPTSSELVDVTGAESTPIAITGEQVKRRWLDMAAGAPFPSDWSPESNTPPAGGVLVQPPDVTESWGTKSFHWSDDGSTLQADSPWWGKYRLIAKTRAGYIVVRYRYNDDLPELRVWTEIGLPR